MTSNLPVNQHINILEQTLSSITDELDIDKKNL